MSKRSLQKTKCPDKQYYDQDFQSCKPCDKMCLKGCEDRPLNCLETPHDGACLYKKIWNESQQQVICIDKCYDPIQKEFLPGLCQDKCGGSGSSCRFCNNNVCSKCNNPKHYLYEERNACVDGCGDGWYVHNLFMCSRCYHNCKTCNDFSQCTTCADGLKLQGSECKLACNIGYYAEKDKCVKCDQELKCSACTNKICTSCQDNNHYIHPEGFCGECDISKGYYVVDKIYCKKCLNYIHPDGFCGECDISKGYYVVDKIYCKKCLSGSYIKGDQCLKCNDNCETCENDQTCTKCKSGLYLNEMDGSCSNCVNYYKDEQNKVCKKCDKNLNCLKCTLNYNSCDSCNGGEFLLKERETLKCDTCKQAGHYVDGVECKKCISNCSECSDDKICKKCNETFFLKGDGTCSSCSQEAGFFQKDIYCKQCNQEFKNCKTCNVHKCEVCIKGFIMNSVDECAECKEGEYNTESQKCQSCVTKYGNCEECDQKICKKCRVGYKFSQQSEKCEVQKEPTQTSVQEQEDINESLDISLSTINLINVLLQVIGTFSTLAGSSLLSFSSQSFQQLGNFVVHKDELKKQGVGQVFVNQFYQYNLFTVIPNSKILSSEQDNAESDNSNQNDEKQNSRLLVSYQQVLVEPEFNINFFESMFFWIITLVVLIAFYSIIFFVREKFLILSKIHQRRTDILILFVFFFSNFSLFNLFISLKNSNQMDMSKGASIISIISLIIYIIIYAISFFSHFKTVKQSSDEKIQNSNQSILIAEISQKNNFTKYFWLVFEIKKFLQVMLTVLINSILVSLICAMILNLLFLSYVVIFKPIESVLKRSFLIMFEIMTFIMLIILLVVSQSQNSKDSRSSSALIMISIMIITSLISTLAIIIYMVRSLIASRKVKTNKQIDDIRIHCEQQMKIAE